MLLPLRFKFLRPQSPLLQVFFQSKSAESLRFLDDMVDQLNSHGQLRVSLQAGALQDVRVSHTSCNLKCPRSMMQVSLDANWPTSLYIHLVDVIRQELSLFVCHGGAPRLASCLPDNGWVETGEQQHVSFPLPINRLVGGG